MGGDPVGDGMGVLTSKVSRRAVLPLTFLWAVAVIPAHPARAAAPQGSRPNIVLIVSDDQSIDAVGAAMPFLRSKPGGHWVEFSNALDNTPLCCPSRATLLTGLYPHHHGVEQSYGEPFDESATLATWLSAAGYRTGLAGKYLNDYPYGMPPWVPEGWSDWFANMNRTQHYNYDMFDNGSVVHYGTAHADYQTDVIARRADTFIRSAQPSEPFFLYATPIAPHEPLVPPQRYAQAPVSITRPPNFNEADVSDKPGWVQALPLLTASQANVVDGNHAKSLRMVMAVDDLVRTVFTALEDKGILDDTVIVFMTDNGFEWGEHRHSGKSCAYESCVRTPLLIRYPWAPGHVEARLASSIDIAPTVAEIAGIVPSDPVDGTSLLPLVQGGASTWRSQILLEYQAPSLTPRFWAVRSEQFKYVELETGEKELYDLVNDPYEMQNQAGQPAFATVQAALADDLAALKAEPPHMVLPSLSIADAQATEDDLGLVHIDFVVSLSAASPVPVEVRASTSDGTATAPADFASTVQTMTFAPGEREKIFSVALAGDVEEEPNESFSVVLDQEQNAIITRSEGTGTILDDDAAAVPSLSVDDVVVQEGDAGTIPATFTVTLMPPGADEVSVAYQTVDGSASAGDDYQEMSGVVTFAPGETSKAVTVSVSGDESIEPDETFSLVLSAPVGAPIADGTGEGVILTDDVPASASIGDASIVEPNDGTTSVGFTVTISPASAQPITVWWSTADGTATSPGDYEAASGVLNFGPGESSKTLSVSVVGDTVPEAQEEFYVDISSPDASVVDPRGVATVADNDPLPTLAISDVSVTEGTGGTKTVAFVVTLSAASGQAVSVTYQTVDGTAKAPSDYLAASGVIGFAPGETSTVVSVVVVGDGVSERTETFTVTLSSPSGASIGDSSGKCSLLNDD